MTRGQWSYLAMLTLLVVLSTAAARKTAFSPKVSTCHRSLLTTAYSLPTRYLLLGR